MGITSGPPSAPSIRSIRACRPPTGIACCKPSSPRLGRTRRRRRSAALLQLIPLGVALALMAGVAAVAISVSGDEGRGDEQEATSGFRGAAIIHYVVRESVRSPDGSHAPVVTSETWQLEDGSRARTVSHWEGAGPLRGTTSEDVVTSTLSLAYRPAAQGQPARIIRYRASDDFAAIPEDPPPFGAPPIGGSSAVGDPRTVPDRLAAGDKDVAQLAGTTVRGIAVNQFEVGHCGESTSTESESEPRGAITVTQRSIVALTRDTDTPVRVTQQPCPGHARQPSGTRILDYLSFEDVPATPENLKLTRAVAASRCGRRRRDRDRQGGGARRGSASADSHAYGRGRRRLTAAAREEDRIGSAGTGRDGEERRAGTRQRVHVESPQHEQRGAGVRSHPGDRRRQGPRHHRRDRAARADPPDHGRHQRGLLVPPGRAGPVRADGVQRRALEPPAPGAHARGGVRRALLARALPQDPAPAADRLRGGARRRRGHRAPGRQAARARRRRFRCRARVSTGSRSCSPSR